MVWIRNEVTNPASGTILIKFQKNTEDMPHSGLVGVVGIIANSNATVELEFRRMNYSESVIRTWWKIYLAANTPYFIRSLEDPFEQKIGIPEAGSYEKIDVRNVNSVTGKVFVAIEVIGGPIEIIVGEVW